jgi:hypothetical protein
LLQQCNIDESIQFMDLSLNFANWYYSIYLCPIYCRKLVIYQQEQHTKPNHREHIGAEQKKIGAGKYQYQPSLNICR